MTMILLLALTMWLQVQSNQVQVQPNQVCHYQDRLPDSACTPGVADPDATMAAVCVPGYAESVRPSPGYATRLKRRQMRAYGVSDQPRSDFREDHLVALEIGGNPTDPANLWPQPRGDSELKDQLENTMHEMVCSGQLPIEQAQQEMANDWYSAYLLYVATQ